MAKKSTIVIPERIDPSARAIAERFKVQPEPKLLALMHHLVQGMKRHRVFQRLDVFHLYDAHSVEDKYLNWMGANFTAKPIDIPLGAIRTGFQVVSGAHARVGSYTMGGWSADKGFQLLRAPDMAQEIILAGEPQCFFAGGQFEPEHQYALEKLLKNYFGGRKELANDTSIQRSRS